MSKPLVERVPFAKIMIGLAVALIVGLGMCGMGFASYNSRFFGGILVGSVVLMLVGVIGLVVTGIVWAIAASSR